MPTALIADNDPGVRALLTELARRSGFEVNAVADGEAARAELRAGGVDLLVCDLDMPQLSGQQLIDWLAVRGDAPAVVVVSGYIDGAIQQALARVDCVRTILRKPFDIMAFVVLLRAMVAEFRVAVPQPATPAVGDSPVAVVAVDGREQGGELGASTSA